MEDSGLKPCPFCKEMIRQGAIKCRFCGEWLEQNAPTPYSSPQIQVPPEPILPPPLPKPDEPTPPTLNTGKVTTRTAEKKGIPVKTLYWISAALLSLCALVWFIGLATIPWAELSPEKQGIVTQKLTEAFLRLFLCAGLLAWTVKRKGYRLLTFSAVCTVMTAISAYYFQVGEQQSSLQTKQSNAQLTENLVGIYSNQLKFVQSGATNSISNNIQSTGDAENDAVLLWADIMTKDISQFVVNMNTEINALQEQDVFDTSLLTVKSNLDAEISKRLQHQRILEKYKAGWLPMLESAKGKFTLGNISDKVKNQILAGAEDSIQKNSSQANELFGLLSKANQSELEFLRFMVSTFGDYQLQDNSILFSNLTNSQKYSELTQQIQDATKEVEAFRAQYLKKAENTKQQLIQELNK